MQTTRPRPAWLSSDLYPFESRFFDTDAGALHYIDVGSGRPLVFVHGNPSWSFEFRRLIQDLGRDFRCIAVDHLGFGLSDKGAPEAEWHPRRHAARLAALVEHLGLDDITWVMADWGGPMALDVTIAHPDRVSGLVLLNTWAWPVDDDMHFKMFSWMMGGPFGQFGTRYFNVFVNWVLPTSVGVKSALTPQVMSQYRGPLATPSDRGACAVLPYYIVGATPWLADIWRRRDAFLGKPALAVWGGSDIAFREKELDVWKRTLTRGMFHFYKQAGHMIAEEIPDVAIGHIRDFMATTRAPAAVPA